MDRDERETVKIMEFVQDRQNPFDLEKVPDELINITSGQVASQKISQAFWKMEKSEMQM